MDRLFTRSILDTRIVLLGAALLIFLGSTRSPGWAEPAPTSQPFAIPVDDKTISRLLDGLASTDAAVRETSRLQLMQIKRTDLNALRRIVERGQPLLPSQVIALRQIVREIYLAGEEYEKVPSRGFLGILMDRVSGDLQQPNENAAVVGVVVADRIPGFCASRVLRDGDIILGTVDPPQAFTSVSDLQATIGGLDPGTEVKLQVLRQGQVVKVTLILDCRPVEADGMDMAENFRTRREEKFSEYWQHEFVPLLKETANLAVGSGQ